MMRFKTYPTMVWACGAAALLAVFVAGCDLNRLLDVSDPSRLLAEDVETPAQAGSLMNGLESDFLCAFGSYVQVTADLSDEFEDTNSQGDSWTLDRRRPEDVNSWGDNDCTARLPSAYVPASRARWVADNLVHLLESWTDEEVDSRQERLARASLLAGFSAYMLGAAHCSAALDEGPELTSMQLFAEAETRFTKALEAAQSAGLSDVQNAARVGRARVRLFQGNDQGALSDAQAVGAGFVMNTLPSDATNRLWNRVWDANHYSFDFGVPEWSRELMTGGVVDPRTLTHDTGQDSGWSPTTVWAQEKYSSVNSPMPVARWEEAQLIIAEIQGGQTAVDIINTLRDPWGLPQFSSTDEGEIQDMVTEERRRELWFEGHRAYDIRRLNLPLFPAPGTEYQPGLKGGTYGDQTCIPMPIVESFNNKTIRGGG
ncbi:RagB/SusD family nutrient uptake outer membrane protein [Gemmatimonadota bacterium]